MNDAVTATATRDRASLAMPMRPVRLLVIEGPDRGLETSLTSGTAIVGTAEGCFLRLTDCRVSRRHCSIARVGGSALRVADLTSKNGTRYLGARITSADVPVGGAVALGDSLVALLPSQEAGELSPRTELAGLLGRSPPMRRLFAQLERAAGSDIAVLVVGETGTGKEAVARALHSLSPRRERAFAVLDCGSMRPELVQSTLFGHVRGAFTGAVADAAGLFEAADGGTLFLDSVCDLPLELQPALLRALEQKTFQRLGEGTARHSDVRVIAASRTDLEEQIAAGRFRSDLFHRLAGVSLALPPLRERLEDVPLLVEHFSSSGPSGRVALPASTVASLCAYPWPGNVRELRNAVERIMLLGADGAGSLPGASSAEADASGFYRAREGAIKAFERSYLTALLEKHSGNAAAAARDAQVARSYFYRLLEDHGLRGRRGG